MSADSSSGAAAAAPSPPAVPRSLRLGATHLPVLTDPRSLRITCNHLPPGRPTTTRRDPVVVLEVADAVDQLGDGQGGGGGEEQVREQEQEHGWRHLGSTETLPPWLTAEDEEMVRLHATAGLDFGDAVSVRDDADAGWVRASFKHHIQAVWRVTDPANQLLRCRLYYRTLGTPPTTPRPNGGVASDEAVESWLADADLIAEAVCPLSEVISHKRGSQGQLTQLQLVSVPADGAEHQSGGVAALGRSTITIHAPVDKAAAAEPIFPVCVVYAADADADADADATPAKLGQTEVSSDPETRLSPLWSEEVGFGPDEQSRKLLFSVWYHSAGAGCSIGVTGGLQPGVFVGQADVGVAELLAAPDCCIELKLRSRGDPQDVVRPIHLAQSTLLVDGQTERLRRSRNQAPVEQPVSILQLMDGDGDGIVTQEEYAAFVERQLELKREVAVSDMNLFVSKATVTMRSGCELTTPAIDVLEVGTVVEVLETRRTRDGTTRIRTAEGWASIVSKKGKVLLQCLGEERLARVAERKRHIEEAEQQRRDGEMTKLLLRGARRRLMQLIADKLREEARERDAFDEANLKRMLEEKRAEEAAERAREQEFEQRQAAQAALDEAKAAERSRLQQMLGAENIDMPKQTEAIGESLDLSAAEYACVRMLHVVDLVKQPLSDGVKDAMKRHVWPGQSWKKDHGGVWLARCREIDTSLDEDRMWPLEVCLKIAEANAGVLVATAPDDVQGIPDVLDRVERSIHHVTYLTRYWQWLVDGDVNFDVSHGIAAVQFLLRIVGSPQVVALQGIVADLQEINVLEKAVQKLDQAKKNKQAEIKRDRKRQKQVFRKIDVDKSGDLDCDELVRVAELLGYEPGNGELESAFKDMDTDSDGKVSVDEFASWWQICAAAERIAMAIDEDEEGHVHRDELASFFELANSIGGLVQPDPSSRAAEIVQSEGNGEFVRVQDVCRILLETYRDDRGALGKIEDQLYTSPEPIYRGVLATHCATMQVLKLMYTLQTQLRVLLSSASELKLDLQIDLPLEECCKLIIEQNSCIASANTSIDIERVTVLCKYVLEHRSTLLLGADTNIDVCVRAMRDVYELLMILQPPESESIESRRNKIMCLRDIFMSHGSQARVAVKLGVEATQANSTKEYVSERPLFGRDSEVQQLVAAVAERGSRVLCHGPPGCGKTSVLRECIQRLALRFDICAHLDGLTGISLYDGWLRIGLDYDDNMPNAATLTADNVHLVTNFLDYEEEWLIVVDNASDASKLMKLLPQDCGHVLMATSSVGNWEPFRDSLTLVHGLEKLQGGVLQQIIEATTEDREQLQHPNLREILEDDFQNLPLMAYHVAMLINYDVPIDELWARLRQSDTMTEVESSVTVADIDRTGKKPGEYTITVKTASVRGSGTDAHVFLQFLGHRDGSELSSDVIALDNGKYTKGLHCHKDRFEHGQTDEFAISLPQPIENLKAVRLMHDNSGLGPDWYVDSIRVSHSATNEVWMFVDGGWLSKQAAKVGERRYRCLKRTPIIEDIIEETKRGQRTKASKIGLLTPGDSIVVVEEPYRVDRGKGKLSTLRVRSPTFRNSSCWAEVESDKEEDVFLEDTGVSLAEIEDLHHGALIMREMSTVDSRAGNLIDYDISVHTGDKSGAGTNANVFVTIYGSKGASDEIQLNAVHDRFGRNDFSRNQVDTFTIFTADVGKVTKLKIRHDDAGFGAGWYLEQVVLINKKAWKQWEFPCEQWLDKGKGDRATSRELLPGAIDAGGSGGYEVAVKTGTMDHAGTDAKVSIDLIGTKGTSGEQALHNPKKNCFEAGNEDVFQVKCSDIGELLEVRIWHNNRGFGPGWFLEMVIVIDKSRWTRYEFPCDQWLDKKLMPPQGDGLIDRVLSVDGTQTQAVVPYEVSISTGNRSSAGTDANVFIQFFGTESESRECLLDAPGDEFERGQTDTFDLNFPNLGTIREVRLWHDNSGLGPGWYVDEIKMTNKLTSTTWTCPCYQWLSLMDDDGIIDRKLPVTSETPLREVPYIITVYTGDRHGAGTDAHVWVVLFGDKAQSNRLFLKEPDGDTSVDTFERGSEDSFTIKIADLGVLKKLRIGHDGSGVGSAWFLHKVRIINLHTSEIYVFPAYQDASVRAGTWLDLKEYEGVSPDKLEVELGAVLEVGVDGKPRQHTEQVVPLPTGMQVVASMTIEALQRSLAEKLTTQIAILEKRQQEAIHRGDFEENKAIDKEIQSVQALLPGVATHSMNLLCALAYFQDATIPTSLFADAAANKAPVSRQAVEDAILVQPAVAIFWDPAVFERSFASLQAIGCIQCVNDNLITHGLMQRSLRMALDMKDDSVAKVVTALLKSRVVSKVGSEASWPDVVPLLSLTWSWFSREACPAVDSAECSWALGRMLEEHGFIDDALPLYEYALFAYQHEFGPLHPKTSTVYNNLGNLYEQHQQWDHALDMYQRALHASEELLGKTHIQISSCCINLAGAHKALDQDIDALPLYRRALFLREQQDAQSTDTATACHHLGMLHAHMKNAAAAFEMFAQALAIRKQKLGISDLETVQTRQALVNAYMDLKMFIEAIPLIQEHLDLCCPENQPDVLLLNNLGYCYEQTNAVSLAIETYLKTMAAAQAQMGPRDQLVGVAAYRLGVMYFATGEFELALPMYELAIEITGDLVEDMSASLNNIGIVYLKMGMHDKAEPPLRQALAMRIEEHGKDHADSMETLWHIAVLLVAKCEDDAGIQEEALQNLRDVISFRLISFGNEHSDFKAAMSLLEVLYNAMLRLLSKDDVQQLLLVQPQTDAAPGPFFNDGTGQFTVDAPPESTVAIGSNVIQTHAMSTHNLLALVFQVIDVDGSGNCSKSELANSQFGKTLQAGLWKDFRSSELAEWNTMDTDGDGMVSLQEWLRFFQKLKADMEIDDAAFKTFCVDCIQNSWRQATSSAHERTVRLLSFVFLKLVPDDSARTRRKSDLIRSALGVVLAEDEFISSSFAAWALEERGDNPDNAVLCTACGRAVHVGAECGWYHRQGTLEDMCESHFSRLDPEASSTAEFLWVDEASVATAIGSQLADYAELYDREKDNSEPAQLSPAAVELADWLALFFDLQPQLYNPGSETATGYGDDAFDVFVTRLLQQASPQLFVEFTEEEEVFAAVDDLLYQVAHRQAMVEQIEDEEAPEDTIKAVVDELVQHVERINNDMQSSELEPGEQQDGLADTRPIRSQRGQLVVTVEKPPANTAADKFTSEDKKMQDRRRYQKMSKLYQRSVDQGDAQRLCQRAYDLAKRVFGDDHPRTASSANNLGTIFLKQRNYEHARPLLEEALLARRHLLGPADPDTATTTHNLGSLNMELWNFEDAALLLTDAAQEELLSVDPLFEVELMEAVNSISCLGAVLFQQGKQAEQPGARSSLFMQAQPLLEASLELNIKYYGEANLETATTMTSLAELLMEKAGVRVSSMEGGKMSRRFGSARRHKAHFVAEAESMLSRALGIRKHLLGERNLDVANTLYLLVTLWIHQGRKSDAIPLLEECLAVRAEVLGDGHEQTEANLLLLLRLREEASELDPVGQRVPLIGLYQRVLRLREAQGIEESEEVLDILNKLGGALTDEGREAEAIPLMEKTLEMTERLFPSQRRGPNPRMASLLNNMAVAYRKEGRDDEALKLWRRDLAICEETVGRSHPDTAVTLHNLAGVHKKRGTRKTRQESPEMFAARQVELREARKLYKRAASIRRAHLGSADPRLAGTLHSLAAVQKELREFEPAKANLEVALGIQRQALGVEHPDTLNTAKHLQQLMKRMQPKTVRVG